MMLFSRRKSSKRGEQQGRDHVDDWSKQFSLPNNDKFGEEGKYDLVVDFRGVSIEFLEKFARELRHGTLMQDTQLMLWNGKTCRVVRKLKNGLVKVRVPFDAQRFYIVPETDLQVKERVDWTTEDIAEYVVLPSTYPDKCCYIHLLDEEVDVGSPFQGAFVSQARKCRFVDLVDALVENHKKCGKNRFAWLDLFGANQPILTWGDSSNQVQRSRESLLHSGLHLAIEKFDERIVFCDSWFDPAPLKRAWCIWEIYGTIKAGLDDLLLVFSHGQDEVLIETLLEEEFDVITQYLSYIDLRDAQCFDKEDLRMIHEKVSSLDGGFAKLNTEILAKLRGWVMDVCLDAVETKLTSESLSNEQMSRLLSQTAKFALFQNLMDVSKTYFDKALALVGEDSVLRAQILADDGLAKWYVLRADYREATKLYQKAKAIGEEKGDALVIANSLNGLGSVRYHEKDIDEAIRLFKSAADIRERELGPDHKRVAAALNNLAACYQAKESKEAIPIYQRVLEIFLVVHGKRHPNVALVLNNLGNCHEGENAIGFYTESLSIREQVLGTNHSLVCSTLINLALAYARMDDFKQAFKTQKQAVGKLKLLHDDQPNHPRLVQAQKQLERFRALANS